MRIGFDAKRITHNRTGLGNYSRYIIQSLYESYSDNYYYLYSPSPGKEDLRKEVQNESVSFHYPQGIASKISPLWRSYSIATELIHDGIELFHGLSNEIPFTLKGKIPSVLTIHDLIFLRLPQCYSFIDRQLYNYKYKRSAQLADRIIAVSECTKKDIIELWNIPESNIDVIYQDCDKSFTIPATEKRKREIANKYDLEKPFILYVGSVEKRKNLLLIIQALKEIKEDIRLIAIGRKTSYNNEVEKYIEENNLEDRVKIFTNVPFSDLPAIYQLAELFIYPSLYEGFGIPIIEALHSGVPVIGATGSCLEEAGGPASLYTNPYNYQELTSMIRSVLTESGLATHMINEGKKHVQQFNKKITTPQLYNLYNEVKNIDSNRQE